MFNKNFYYYLKNYWFYLFVVSFILIFNFKFITLFEEYVSLFSNYQISIRDNIYTPISSNVYIFSNLEHFYSYFILFFISIFNSDFILRDIKSLNIFNSFYFSKNDSSYLLSILISKIIILTIVVNTPLIFINIISFFYNIDFIYLFKLMISNTLVILFFLPLSTLILSINLSYYISIFLSLISCFLVYHFILVNEFLVFFKGGINYKLIVISFFGFILFFILSLKIKKIYRYK